MRIEIAQHLTGGFRGANYPHMTAAPTEDNFAWSKRLLHVEVTLRPPYIEHLRYIAKWDEVSLTKAFVSLLASHKPAEMALHPGPTVRTHLALDGHATSLIDALAMQWGMPRTEAIRRVIDLAIAKEQFGGDRPLVRIGA
jgi:hypothetical protein